MSTTKINTIKPINFGYAFFITRIWKEPDENTLQIIASGVTHTVPIDKIIYTKCSPRDNAFSTNIYVEHDDYVNIYVLTETDYTLRMTRDKIMDKEEMRYCVQENIHEFRDIEIRANGVVFLHYSYDRSIPNPTRRITGAKLLETLCLPWSSILDVKAFPEGIAINTRCMGWHKYDIGESETVLERLMVWKKWSKK